MIFKSLFTASPYPWAVLSALFIGAAVNRATRRLKRISDRETARTVKWSLFSLYLSVSLVFALSGIFIPGPLKIISVKLLYFFLSASLLFFLGFRFKKSIGLIISLLVIVTVSSVFLFVHSLNAFTGETKIADIRVLDLRNGVMKLEIIQGPSGSEIAAIKGEYFAPIVKEIIFDDYFVFLGVKTWYRFMGVTGFSFVKENGVVTLKQTDRGFYFPEPEGISDYLYGYFEKYEGSIPGVKSVQVDITAKKAVPLRVYSLFIQNDGGLQIAVTKE